MFELTSMAGAKLLDSLSAVRMPDRGGKCYRLVSRKNKLVTLKLARPVPGDTLYGHQGRGVLALPKALEPYLRDKRLDIDRTGKLKLRQLH